MGTRAIITIKSLHTLENIGVNKILVRKLINYKINLVEVERKFYSKSSSSNFLHFRRTTRLFDDSVKIFLCKNRLLKVIIERSKVIVAEIQNEHRIIHFPIISDYQLLDHNMIAYNSIKTKC